MLIPLFLCLFHKRHETEKVIDDINAAGILGFGLEFDGKKWEEAIAVYKNSMRYGPDRAMQHRIFHSISVCSDRLKKAHTA